MKRLLIWLTSIGILTSCSDHNTARIDCSVIDCFGGDILELKFLIGDQNVFISNPNTEILIIQNNDTADYYINTATNVTSLFLYEDDPLTIYVNELEFDLLLTSTFGEGECCSGIQIESVELNGILLCSKEACDELILINIEGF